MFVITVALSAGGAKYGAINKYGVHEIRARWALFFSFLVILLFLGFRYNVGRDYINYSGDYKYIDSSDFGTAFSYYKYEYGYLALLKIARFLNTGPQGIFFFSSFVLLVLYFNLFRRRWSLLPVSIFVFFVGSPYVFFINGIRQAVAVLAFLNAINSFTYGSQLKKTIGFLAWMALGVLFHTSLLFFLPFIVFQFDRVVNIFNSKLLVIIALSGFILNVLGLSSQLLPDQELLGTEGYSYGNAFDSTEFDITESVLSIGNVFRLLLLLLPLILYDKIKKVYPEINIFFISMAIGSAIFFLFSNNMFTQRMSYYFMFAELLVYPVVSKYCRLHRGKINWWYICSAMFILLYVVSFTLFYDNQIWPNARVLGISIN